MPVLTKTEGVSLYIQIREALREQIAKGVFEQGQKIPSEEELANQYGVSRMTVRQGISDLIDEGILYRRHGVGTFVAQLSVERDHTRLTNFFESAVEEGIEASGQLLSIEVIPAKVKVAKALALEEMDPVIRIKTLRLANQVPVTVHDAYLPYKYFPQLLSEKNLGPRHHWDYIESHGYKIKRAIQKLEARPADEELANLLDVEVGDPILYKERIVFADDGTPVEFTLCYNRGDRYSITFSLSR